MLYVSKECVLARNIGKCVIKLSMNLLFVLIIIIVRE